MANDPIIVLGFGRSGSTWVAEQLQQMQGGVLLNEPLNPNVGFNVEALRWGKPPAFPLAKILDGEVRDPWFVRHVHAPISGADHDRIDDEWDGMRIVGFKDTHHGSLLIPWLTDFSNRIVFVSRDPVAIAASVRSRPSFWALGYPGHARLLFDAVLRSARVADGHAFPWVHRMLEAATSECDWWNDMASTTVVLASLVQECALHDMAVADLPVFDYDDIVASGSMETVGASVQVWGESDFGRSSATRSPTTALTEAERSTLIRLRDSCLSAGVHQRYN